MNWVECYLGISTHIKDKDKCTFAKHEDSGNEAIEKYLGFTNFKPNLVSRESFFLSKIKICLHAVVR